MSDDRAPGGEGDTGPADATSPADVELLNRVPAILYIADLGVEGRWRYVSPQIEAILGFTPEGWCADPGLWARRLHPEDAGRVLADEAAAVASAADGAVDRAGATGETEYRMLHRDGHVVWVRDEALLTSAADGSRRWHGVMSDITDSKAAEAELQRRAAQQAAVARLGEHALEGVDTTALCREALAVAVALLNVDGGAVVELDPGGEEFAYVATRGMPDYVTDVPLLAGSDSQAGYTLLSGGPVAVDDRRRETRFESSEALSELGALSCLTVVVQGRRAPFGVLGLHSRVAGRWLAGDIDFVQSLANILGDAFERQLTEDNIRHRALHDPLTGLPNRVLFMDRLGQAIQRLRRRRSAAAILVVDIDRFQLVNDSLGHAVGDELLAAAAPRLHQAVRASDTVARFGSDEFGILLEDIAGEHDAIEMAQRIAGVFNRPFVLDGSEHFVTTSIGISLAQGGERAEDVVRDADAAMNRAKERGRARYELFDEGIRGRAISRLRVENDLRRALQRDELILDYQPLVSLRDRSIAGVEALVRWEHPDRGRIPPAEFIPVAEDSGLIDPIGRWVLDQACRQAAFWYGARPDAPPISLSVNLSAVQFENRGLPEMIATALRATGLDPGLLAVELTESVMVGDAEELTRMLQTLKAIGIRLVLDDFGTGYSSLAYLTRLPLDALKIDGSFVAGLGTEPRDTAICEAIVAMSHALSLQVVGEGVETERQLAELSRLGCDLAQGYHFSAPVPAPLITRMLDRGPSWVSSAR